MNHKTITRCRSCGSKDLKGLLSLGDQKIVEFTNKPVSIPLDLVRCETCTLVQLRHSTKPELLWNEGYGYRSGVNDSMVKHLREIASEASKYVKDGDTVLDIGCNDGTLLKGYTKNVIRVGIDPSENVAKYAEETLDGLDHKIVYDFFNANSLPYQFKVITAISMFYDLDDPNSFIEDILKVLLPEGVFIIQQNYFGSMLENYAFDNICHEHLEYYTLTSLQNLLSKHGLMVFKVEENELNGGSFRTYICRIGEREVDSSVKEMLKKELSLPIDEFIKKVADITASLKDLVEQLLKEGKTIYVYGASTRGGTLLQACGLDNKHIRYAVERNPDKWGKIMQSVGVPIISESQFRRDNPDYTIILPWFFADHFIEREKEYLWSGGHFIVPLPHIKIV